MNVYVSKYSSCQLVFPKHIVYKNIAKFKKTNVDKIYWLTPSINNSFFNVSVKTSLLLWFYLCTVFKGTSSRFQLSNDIALPKHESKWQRGSLKNVFWNDYNAWTVPKYCYLLSENGCFEWRDPLLVRSQSKKLLLYLKWMVQGSFGQSIYSI